MQEIMSSNLAIMKNLFALYNNRERDRDRETVRRSRELENPLEIYFDS